ncbi:MAG: hypothetical protein NVSMB25_10450 [Thermoleophilaceae bacterium]
MEKIMTSRNRRLALSAVILVAAVVAFAIAKPSSRSSKHGPVSATVEVRGGRPVGGVRTITVTKGEPLTIRVASDVADEIHIHGYDYHREVAAGGSVTFNFPARIDGAFVIELEKRATQIASLQVRP